MNRSYEAMRALLTADGPNGLRWTIERARAADHQLTPIIALPPALHEYFADVRSSLTPPNRMARVTSATRQPR